MLQLLSERPIFVRTDQHFSKTDIPIHCKEQDFEICAIQLVTKTSNLIILSLYRASFDVNKFQRRLDATLKLLYNSKSEFIISRDINVNSLNKNNHKIQVNSLLNIYNLLYTVNFSIRIQNFLSTATDNNFIDSMRSNSPCTSPIVNGFSDHDSQFLTVHNITAKNTLETQNQKNN
jgi:hypothetical protein